MNATSASNAPAKAHAGNLFSRRRFLRGTALALASGFAFPTLIPARALGRAGAVAPSNRLTLGLIGAAQGMVDVERCLPFADVQVVAVCETDSERGEKAVKAINGHYKQTTARHWRDFREMYDRAGLDTVIIATPDHWHGIMGVEALRRGIDVFGEKPLAHTLTEGRAIVNAARQHGRVWQSGSWQRSVPLFRRAAELVRGGFLGKISHVEVGTYGGSPEGRPTPKNYGTPPATLDYDLWVGPAAWTDYDPRVTHLRWRYVRNYGGGRLIDFVGHHLDIAHWALGLDATGPLKVSGSGELSKYAPYDTEDTYTYHCEYAGGLHFTVSSELTPGVKFFGENGKWLYVGRARGINGAAFINASHPAILQANPEADGVTLYRSDNHWRNFFDCVKTRAATIAPPEAGQRSTSVGHLAHIAIQTGRTIHWDPATETIKDDPGASALLAPAFRAGWGIC